MMSNFEKKWFMTKMEKIGAKFARLEKKMEKNKNDERKLAKLEIERKRLCMENDAILKLYFNA